MPPTEKAFRKGALAERQAIEVVAAGVLDVASQEELLYFAEAESYAQFHHRAQRIRGNAMDEEQKHRRAHQNRKLIHWTDEEGVFRLDGRLTTASGATVLACLQPFFNRITRQAAKDKIKESAAAHLADALVHMSQTACTTRGDGGIRGPRAVVHLRLDYAALERGYLESGDICEVPGVGPVPLETAREFLADSYRVGVLKDGEDIKTVKGLGHSIPDRLRRAVYERDDYRCVIPGCVTDHGAHQIDHVIPVHQRGETKLYNLALLCPWHHKLKTYYGYTLKHYRYRWLWWGPHDPPPEEDDDQLELPSFTLRAKKYLGAG